MAEAEEHMYVILTKLGLKDCIDKFIEEKITPDIISYLSLTEFEQLGITDPTDFMEIMEVHLDFTFQNQFWKV